MHRRSFFKQLFGAVVGGLAAPQLTSAAASIVVIDPIDWEMLDAMDMLPREPPFMHYPMNGGMYAADHPVFRHDPPRYYEAAVVEDVVHVE